MLLAEGEKDLKEKFFFLFTLKNELKGHKNQQLFFETVYPLHLYQRLPN